MGGTGISKSQVSRLCAEIDERVNAFLSRPIEGSWPYLWIDATYLKSRKGGRIVSVAVIVAVAVNTDRRREVLGVATGASEAEVFWTLDDAVVQPAFARRPGPARGEAGHRRRPQGPAGSRPARLPRRSATLPGALGRLVPAAPAATDRARGARWTRNLLAHAGAKQRAAVAAMIRTIVTQESKAEAFAPWDKVADALRDKHDRLGALMDAAREDVLTSMDYPKEHWAQIASTNPLERVNKEIKRRADVVGIFPNDEAIVRLVGALMLEQSDEWAVSRRYFSLESLASLADTDAAKLPALAA
jgi:putative transposase